MGLGGVEQTWVHALDTVPRFTRVEKRRMWLVVRTPSCNGYGEQNGVVINNMDDGVVCAAKAA